MDNIRVKKESLSNWRSQFEIKEDQVDEGVKTAIGLGLLATPYLLKKFVKPKVDKKIEDARNNLKIGGNRRSGTTTEEVQGGISVQNYSDGVQFNEIETVDIIKAEPLNPSNWRNDLDILGEGNRTRYKGISISGSGNKKDMSKGPNEKALIDYTKIQANAGKKKEVVSASHEVEGDLVDEGLVRGAVQGAGLLWKLGKWAIPKAARALRNKGAADINKFKKSQELVKRVNNIEKIRATKSLKGTDVKGVFTKSKVKPGLNKVNWQSTVPVVSNRVSTASTRALTGGVETAKKIGSKVTKVKRQKITAKAQEVLDKIKSGKKLQSRMDAAVSTSRKPGTLSQRTDDLIARIRADKGSAIVKSQKGSLATQKSRALTKLQNRSSSITTTPSSSVTRTSGSSITKTPNTRASDATVDVKATTVKQDLKSAKPYSAKREYAKGWMRYNKAASATLRADKASAIARTAASGLVGLTVGGKVGQDLGKSKDTTKDLSLEKDKKELDTLKKKDKVETETSKATPEIKKETPKVTPEIKKETPEIKKETPKVAPAPDQKDPPNENKAIIDTEKKEVNPEKNPEVKVIKSSPKDRSSTEDSEKAAWLHKTRNSPAAKSGKFSDDQRWETQKKHRKWKANRKKKKEVSEGAVTAVRVASQIPWGKVAGTVLAAKGGEKILNDLLGTPGKPKDTDWVKNPKDDIDRELNTRQNQAKDAEENKEHDDALKVYGKTIDKKTGKTTLTPEQQIEVIKAAAAKHKALKNVKKDKK